jgi:hypothetical protein
MKNDCATMDNDEQQIIAAIEKRYGKEISYGRLEYFFEDGKVTQYIPRPIIKVKKH